MAHGSIVELDAGRSLVSADGIEGLDYPVSRAELLRFRWELSKNLVALVQDLQIENRQEDSDVLAVLLIRLVVGALGLFEATAQIIRFRSRGLTVRPAQGSNIIAGLLTGAIEIESSTTQTLRNGPTFRPREKLQIFRWAKNMITPKVGVRSPIGKVDYRENIVCNTNSAMIEAHAEQLGLRVIYQGNHLWFNEVLTATEGSNLDLPVTKKIIEIVHTAFANQDVMFTSPGRQYLEDLIQGAFQLTRIRLRSIRKIPERIPMHLWTGTASSTWGRILRIAALHQGAEVVGHDHGAGSGHKVEPTKSFLDLDICTEFVSFGKGQVAGLQRNLTDTVMVKRDFPEILSCPLSMNSLPAQVRRQASRKKYSIYSKQSRKRLLYVSSLATKELQHFTPLFPQLVLVDWYARIISRMSSWGYELFWKPHKDDPANVLPAQFLDRYGVRRLSQCKVEDWYQRVDSIVYDADQSSAFASVVHSDTPMVFINNGSQPLEDRAEKILNRRCVIVHASLDKRNRIQVDWGELEEGLRHCLDRHDYQFADRYVEVSMP